MSSEIHNSASRRGRKSRRQFLLDGARTACGVGICGLFLGVLSRQAESLPAQAIRPPGARTEDEFLSACVRCGLCVRDCPYDTLDLARLGDAVAVGTPYFTARTIPCEMCDDIPCVKACPTGALDPELTNIDDAHMGLAVLIDQENCLNFLGLRCDVCYRVCPLIDEAISLELQRNERTGKHAKLIPVVHSDACTGCGKCEQACVLEEAAIKVIPERLAQGTLGRHYGVAWEGRGQESDLPVDEQPLTAEQIGSRGGADSSVPEPSTPFAANPLDTLNADPGIEP